MSFNPRFGGEAGRTLNLSVPTVWRYGFNPRFGGEAGRTVPTVWRYVRDGIVSIPDLVGGR